MGGVRKLVRKLDEELKWPMMYCVCMYDTYKDRLGGKIICAQVIARCDIISHLE